ncbi:MAG: hypothetical protein GY729_09675 [Desulfobacteraceae bacterium]|nr:hypothetical protein [Desulfobacteraceae bacterium]
MDCIQFEKWLLKREVDKSSSVAKGSSEEAIAHMETCALCRDLHCVDNALETRIQSALDQQELPIALMEQIDITIDHAVSDHSWEMHSHKQPEYFGGHFNFKVWIPAAVIALSLVFLFFPQSTPRYYQNLQQLNEQAVMGHLKGNQAMTFKAKDLNSALLMLNKELGFNVQIPDLKDQGYVLIGGRLCTLGKCQAAYLFYEKGGKICSLYIMDYDHLNFKMADGSRFSNVIKGCATQIWKERGQVYAMVY